MFRVNIQITSSETMTSGDGVPGGTGGVLFVDSADNNELKLVMSDGTVRNATVGGVNVLFAA